MAKTVFRENERGRFKDVEKKEKHLSVKSQTFVSAAGLFLFEALLWNCSENFK